MGAGRWLAVVGLALSQGCTPCDQQPGTICTYMGTGEARLSEMGALAERTDLYLPQDITFGPDDLPYIVDWNNNRIVTVVEGRAELVAGSGRTGEAQDGPAEQVEFNHPTHVSFTPDARQMIVSAWHNSTVMAMDMDSRHVRTICGDGRRAYAGDGGPAEDAVLDLPVATAFDSSGRMYIMDQANQRVRRVGHDGTIDAVVGPGPDWLPEGYAWVCPDEVLEPAPGLCKVCLDDEGLGEDCLEQPLPRPQGYQGDGGPAHEAKIYLPFSQSAPPAGRMVMGPDDTLYMADTGNHRIRAVDSEGTIRTVAGSGPDHFDPDYTGGYGGNGGPAEEALLMRPIDVALDEQGNLYVADTDNSCIRMVDAEGIIHTVAGICGERGFEGDGGSATDALLDRPYGIGLDADGNLYIADTHNHRMRVVYGPVAN